METDPKPSGEIRILPSEPAPSCTGRHLGAAVFDREEVLRRLNGNEALLVRLLKIFNDNALTELSRIREAVDRADPDETGRHAHALKGSAANVGALRVQEVARDMEQNAQAGDLILLNALVAQAEQEFGAFLSATRGQEF